MRGVLSALLFVGLMAGAAPAAESQTLAQARALYNDGDYERAVAAALNARQEPHWADAADLVRARALLELYRQYHDAEYLAQARGAFGAVDATTLSPRDQIDLLIGLGQSLYLEEDAGAAAEVFDSALGAAAVLEVPDRLLLLDWWASAVDRDPRTRPIERRVRAYLRLAERMETELRQDPGNPAANYWLAAAARGSGDVERAWHAAIAGWVRAALYPESTDRLRADLDRLVTDALVTERARAYPAAEREQVRAGLREQWERVKVQWK
jgi:hypothetical protein